MEFFMSSESDSRYDNFEEPLRRVRKSIIKELKPFLIERNYGTEVIDISIIPIIMKFDEKMDKEGWFKEKVFFKKQKQEADIRLRIDYDKFVNGDDNTKKLLLIDNVVKSIRVLSKKAKNDFKAKELENDILKLFNLTNECFENI